jgi:hypothetical protein
MDVTELVKQAKAKTPPTRAIVRGLARELDIDEGFLQKLADESASGLGPLARAYDRRDKPWSL